jgi:hypothetical protein
MTKEKLYKYCEEEINAVNNKAIQTKEALKKFNKEDPYHFLREYLLPRTVFKSNEKFTTTRKYYISK